MNIAQRCIRVSGPTLATPVRGLGRGRQKGSAVWPLPSTLGSVNAGGLKGMDERAYLRLSITATLLNAFSTPFPFSSDILRKAHLELPLDIFLCDPEHLSVVAEVRFEE